MSFVMLSRVYLEGEEDWAFQWIKDFEDIAVEAMIDGKGLSYSDEELNRAQRILKFIDDEMRGVNDSMKQVSIDRSGKDQRQFVSDVEAEGLQ